EVREASQRKKIAAEYDCMLAGFMAGNIVEVELDPDDDRRTVRNRFRAAAQRRDLIITFLPNREGLLRFKLSSPQLPIRQPAARSWYSDRPSRRFPPRRWRR